MLRSRSQALAWRTPVLQMQQRALWGRASDLLSWVGLSDSPRAADKPTPPAATDPVVDVPDAAETAVSQSGCGTSERVIRPHPPMDIAFQFPTLESKISNVKRRASRKTATTFSRSVMRMNKVAQLMETWQLVSQCRPFVLDEEDRMHVRLATARDAADRDALLLQMLPADVYAQVTTGIVENVTFWGLTASSPPVELESGVEAAPSAMHPVTVLSETMVLDRLMKAFHAMEEYDHAVSFFEAYDRDRSVWLQEQLLLEASSSSTATDGNNDAEKKAATHFTRATEMGWSAHKRYLLSLAHIDQSKFVRLLEGNNHQLEQLCNTVTKLRILLQACFDQKNGVVARRALDAIAESTPVAIVPLNCYELGIRINLRAKNRSERELQNALHVARQMYEHGGYVLKPMDWSALIKVSLKMNRGDCALEVFKQYRQNRILENQKSFRQVLRAACALQESETVLAMVRYWLGMDAVPLAALLAPAGPDEQKEYEEATFVKRPVNTSDPPLEDYRLMVRRSTKSDDRAFRSVISLKEFKDGSDTEMLNMVLWEMLKHKHEVPALKQLLTVMNSRRAMGGAVVLRQAVARLVEYDEKQTTLSPHQVIVNSLQFWQEQRRVLTGEGFLVHLLLEHCLGRQWDDECMFLIDYMLEREMERVPLNSVVKVMQSNELRGRFDANARIGDNLLAQLPDFLCRKLSEQFYEHYLMSYLRLERFEDVPKLHMKLKLDQCFPHNEVLRTLVRDAANR